MTTVDDHPPALAEGAPVLPPLIPCPSFSQEAARSAARILAAEGITAGDVREHGVTRPEFGYMWDAVALALDAVAPAGAPVSLVAVSGGSCDGCGHSLGSHNEGDGCAVVTGGYQCGCTYPTTGLAAAAVPAPRGPDWTSPSYCSDCWAAHRNGAWCGCPCHQPAGRGGHDTAGSPVIRPLVRDDPDEADGTSGTDEPEGTGGR